ncbi:MAG: CPBP family intramembrane glutamic endopeptidase [Planctomycetota bacterium]
MTKAKKTSKKEGSRRLGANQLFNFTRDSYLERTSRPIYAIVFLLPLIVFYELGTFQINTDVLNQSQIRVVAFVWLQNALESLGFGGKFAWVAPPLAVVVILMGLQITSGKQWRFWFGDVLPMTIECVMLAVPLIVLTLFLNSPMVTRITAGQLDGREIRACGQGLTNCSAATDISLSSTADQGGIDRPDRPLLANVVTGIGAGIYEELVFRLILICLLMLLFQDALRFTHLNSIVLSVLISAAMFSAHHHIDFLSGRPNAIDPFNLTKFIFRTVAGIYFAALFAIRGFGITAGTHAAYNIIAVSITARFFP